MLTPKKLIRLIAVVASITLAAGCSSGEQAQSTTTAIAPSVTANAHPSPTANTESPLANNPSSASCENAQTQAQINQCAGSEASSADAKLNQVYRQLRTKLKGSSQEQRLINAQQKWIAFRDADCKYAENQYEGGSFAPAARAFCITNLTQQRTKDLQAYLEFVDR
jgi:uncharacterized protein YecT (DUF1311 family)